MTGRDECRADNPTKPAQVAPTKMINRQAELSECVRALESCAIKMPGADPRLVFSAMVALRSRIEQLKATGQQEKP